MARTQANETPQSWVRFELDVPLALLNEVLEHRLPRDGGGTRHVTLAEGFDLEIGGERDPFRLAGRRDSLVVRTRLRHWLDVQGKGLQRVGCGSVGAPLTAELACTARFGWNDAWGLEAIASAQGMVFARRCKPDPPRINLTKRAGPVLEEMFLDPVVVAATDVAASVQSREFIAAVWDALAGGALLADGWLDFAPEAVFVDPVSFSGSAVAIRGAIQVRPELRAGPAKGTATSFPAGTPTRVRLSGRDLGVAVQIEAGLANARDRLHAAVDSALAIGTQLEKVTLRASEQALEIGIDLAGDLAGSFAMTAALAYEDLPPALVAWNLAWTETTRTAIARLEPAQQERLAALLTIVGRAARIDFEEPVARANRDLGANLRRRLGDGLVLDGALHARRLLAIQGTGDHVSVRLVFSGPAVIRPFAAKP